MRRILLLACFCFAILASPSGLYAQFDFAIQAGANIGSITYDFDDDDESSGRDGGHIGIRLGLVAERTINEKIILHSGIIYSQKGSNVSESQDGESFTTKTTLNYLDIPLLLKYNVGKGYIMGGITLGYALSGKIEWSEKYDGYSDSGTESIVFGNSDDADFGKFDGAISVGVGYPIDVKGYPIVLNAYYNYGIIDIAAIKEGNITTGVIGIGATYFFKRKKSNGEKSNNDNKNSNSGDMEFEEEDWR